MLPSISGQRRFRLAVGVSVVALSAFGFGTAIGAEPNAQTNPSATASPIKHVIVVIGENRSFDHVFGTYIPKRGQTISNLRSKGIVNADGSPGPKFAQAAQFTAAGQAQYFISAGNKTPYTVLPPPDLNGAPAAQSNSAPPFTSTQIVAAIEPGLEPSDFVLLTTGATGAATTPGVDTRVTNATKLPNGPFQLTGATMPYDAYTGDTIHRFYHMWQQSDCSLGNATKANPSGCLNDLYPYVNISFTTGNAGVGNPMAFLNVNHGDAPFLKQLADEFTSSDNFHQSVMGGTGANHVMLGTGDDVFWSDGNGNPVPPPANLIANPNPKPGTQNVYTTDSVWSNCSDPTQPGVGPIVAYLESLPSEVTSMCAPNHFYMLNNTAPGFLTNGQRNPSPSSVPPSSVRTIGDAMIEKNISWRYYGGAFTANLQGQPVGDSYCDICNPFAYATSIMTNDAVRTEHLKDVVDLFSDLQNGTLPAVSFVKPDGLLDGHPQSSKLGLYEAFVKNILDRLHANSALTADTAVFVAFDESGGYYDSGFIQPLDFFGDGPRIPFIVVSPFTTGGRVVHTYYDHVSILKFIERNWQLKPLTARSRDNLPNPETHDDNPYVPANGPAIGDLFDMFGFDHGQDDDTRSRGDHERG